MNIQTKHVHVIHLVTYTFCPFFFFLKRSWASSLLVQKNGQRHVNDMLYLLTSSQCFSYEKLWNYRCGEICSSFTIGRSSNNRCLEEGTHQTKISRRKKWPNRALNIFFLLSLYFVYILWHSIIINVRIDGQNLIIYFWWRDLIIYFVNTIRTF